MLISSAILSISQSFVMASHAQDWSSGKSLSLECIDLFAEMKFSAPAQSLPFPLASKSAGSSG
jgi:hypothetical protein